MKINPLYLVIALLAVVAVLLGLNLMVLLGRPVAAPAATPLPGLPRPEPTMAANDPNVVARQILFAAQGVVVAQGSNTTPVGTDGPQSYRVEDVTLPGPYTFNVLVPDASRVKLEQKKVTAGQFWRLILTGGPFNDQGAYWTIWLDNDLVGLGVPNETLSELTVVIFDRALLREGATITLARKERSDGVALPEKLRMGEGP